MGCCKVEPQAVGGTISTLILRVVFFRQTLHLPTSRKKADGNGNKRLTENREIKKEGAQKGFTWNSLPVRHFSFPQID